MSFRRAKSFAPAAVFKKRAVTIDKSSAATDESAMHRVLRPARSACAAALFAAHLLVIAAAWSSAVHEWLHEDATDAHHECAATAYAGGNLDASVPPPVFAAPPPFLATEGFLDPVVARSVEFGIRSRERAPPAT